MEHNQSAKHTHYVSLTNGAIHPAMTSPAGYEDQHLTEWRPATHTEIQRYLSGSVETLDVSPLPLESLAPSSPTTLQLEPEDPAAPAGPAPVFTPAPPAPAIGELPPVSAPAIAPAPSPVTPAPVAPAPAIPPAATE